MIGKGISLRALELFEMVADTGSVARAAERAGLSLPAVSQALKTLEDAVGRPLLDHARRPMQLTPAGRLFLRRAETALAEIRQGQAEVAMPDLGHLADLGLGIIDDFESEVTPELVTTLAATLTRCRFRLHTQPSHGLLAMLEAGQIDLAVTSLPETTPEGLAVRPLLSDPFLLAVPHGTDPTDDPCAALAALPFLRYSRDQMIGQRIEAELARHATDIPNRFELDSVQSLHALVAGGAGWAITTPLSFLRAHRFRAAIDLHPLPIPGFARQIALVSADAWMDDVADDLAATLRRMIEARVTAPLRDRLPWLDAFRVLDPR
ncbi:LysR family transcriptional regulator [Oceaniglobus roseus]|uniref:LysR family transcriptional regulator n=1 Tax=Oceaniglobus roseus TaxID=1737570 RepID=UPI000C7EAF86|nr:LysR family transcriptional regulator [Kandeliimicrobium roseum]